MLLVEEYLGIICHSLLYFALLKWTIVSCTHSTKISNNVFQLMSDKHIDRQSESILHLKLQHAYNKQVWTLILSLSTFFMNLTHIQVLALFFLLTYTVCSDIHTTKYSEGHETFGKIIRNPCDGWQLKIKLSGKMTRENYSFYSSSVIFG